MAIRSMHYRISALVWLMLLPAGALFGAEPPFALPPQAEINKLKTAVIYTAKGDIRFELFPEEAPWHVTNLKYRSDKGLYRSTVFHIYYPDYIIQGGGPRAKPAATAGYSLPPEFNRRRHFYGTLGMARRPDEANPERASSGNQFHILLREAPHMDGRFTIFGQMTEGGAVLDELREGDEIKDVKVFVTP